MRKINTIKLGLISAPDLPAEIASDLIKELPELLSEKIDKDVSWKVEMTIDSLVGVAENTKEVLEKADNIKEENEWDYAICLTDLPIFFGKYLVVANASLKDRVAQISVPTFGLMPMRRRIRKTLMQMMQELYVEESQTESPQAKLAVKEQPSKSKNKNKNKLTHQFSLSQIGRMKATSKDDVVDLRYFIKSRFTGYLRVLLGMTFANRPWKALFSFNKMITLSFATGSYISIFPTPWQLSIVYTPVRLIILTIIAIMGMVMWVIFSQNLWEKPSDRGKKRWRDLYNWTTFSTLSSIVIINYIVLFMMFSIAISIFVPPELFQAWTGLDEEPTFKYYLNLVWLVTSLGTLAGAIGAGLEKEDKIRNITYSFRQQQRYYEVGQEYDNKEEAEQS
ncbi:hypothetical protein GLV94_11775 [Virgibacillus halodenitrificans]|uniref:5,10-methylene-tetrahydrofolate dehydrogenase n=1 Tax=Virgibacillus halodenitrificans TaxID=1482 RepID=A0ABR7VMI5_VIRHA|nr:hypothetical protein [Virgibacillus halodenitrificans]MBD1223110.1 hypothetical protein [Virgibacillus halodenitrificans]MCG1027336.1 hypothetical protein [Virgibacillus halodenitrificans]MEC2159162.1 hypothetical protein [Virgibacillus halodenitrificans]MYL46322.1 hypothetical protein [Virgibacillus halodenitrificans]MYL57903.1 hypothetical protein [Virgibacillus halodenitrificans]